MADLTKRRSSVAIFAEDWREEKSGTDMLIGIFPDNVNVHSIPGALPKLAVYFRTNIPADEVPKFIEARLEFPWGDPLSFGSVSGDTLAKFAGDARNQGNPIFSVLTRAIIAGLSIQKAGRIVAVVKIDDEELFAGSLNIRLAPEGDEVDDNQKKNRPVSIEP